MYVAFSSLYEGAGHDAARELEGAFGFEPDLESRYLDTAHLLAFLKTDYRDAGILMANRFADISMANGFWIPEHATPMADAYAYTVRALYMGKIGSVPAGESGSKIINDWMAKQTSRAGSRNPGTAGSGRLLGGRRYGNVRRALGGAVSARKHQTCRL